MCATQRCEYCVKSQQKTGANRPIAQNSSDGATLSTAPLQRRKCASAVRYRVADITRAFSEQSDVDAQQLWSSQHSGHHQAVSPEGNDAPSPVNGMAHWRLQTTTEHPALRSLPSSPHPMPAFVKLTQQGPNLGAGKLLYVSFNIFIVPQHTPALPLRVLKLA